MAPAPTAANLSLATPLRRLLRGLTTTATLLLGVGLVWMAGRGLDLDELRSTAGAVRCWPFVLGAIVLMGGPFVLAYEWGIILPGGGERRLPYAVLAPMTIVTLFWQNICHFMLGYGWALHRFVNREKLRPAAALGVISIDQLAEGIAKGFFSGILVFYFLAPDRALARLPFWFAAAILAYFALRPALRRAIERLSQRAERSPSGRKRLVSGAMIERYARMWNERALWICAGLALFKKMFKVAAAYAAQVALGLDLPWIAPFTFIAVLDCATLVPLIPGHMGVYEATAAATYVRFGAGPEAALLIGVLYHAEFLIAAIVPAAGVVVGRLVRRTVELESAVEAEIEHLLEDAEPIEPASEGLAA